MQGVDDGLVAKWHFDEGSGGVVADSSGDGDDRMIHGTTWDGRHVWGEAIYDTEENQSGG
ncbi:MAG: hypothetical protein U9Q68_06030 [Euryarchaeota archaeon]|nr:hypothetical protein [Euryarchaeota archaeon]